MPILANDPNYPQYRVTFDGEFVPGAPVQIPGPHHFHLGAIPANVTVTVRLTRDPAEPGIPQLRITFEKKA